MRAKCTSTQKSHSQTDMIYLKHRKHWLLLAQTRNISPLIRAATNLIMRNKKKTVLARLVISQSDDHL